MFVSEIFRSLQGECLVQGAPSVFVRFAGCDLKCSYCDTSYAQTREGSTEMSPSAILDRIRALDESPRYVCLTGGEPLLQPREELIDLVRGICFMRQASVKNVSVETNGAHPVSFLQGLRLSGLPVSLAVDYKLPSSGFERNMVRGNYYALVAPDVLKFVCQNIEDTTTAVSFLRGLAHLHSCNPIVLFHSVSGYADVALAEYLLRPDFAYLLRRFDIRYGVQLHKLLWGNAKGR